MAAAIAIASTFHLFTSLSAELRDEIWRYALPEKDEPALYFYKKGGWRPERPLPSDIRCGSEDDEATVHVFYRHDMLDAVQVKIPLLFVNHEAHHMVLAWAHKQNTQLRIYTYEQGGSRIPTLVRPFDAFQDVLYIPVDEWKNFNMEPWDRMFQPDVMDRMVCTHPILKKIAIPEALLYADSEVGAFLNETIDMLFYMITTVFIVLDAPLDLLPVNTGMRIQPRWEVKSVEGAAFFWNHDHRRFDFVGDEHTLGEASYKLLKEFCENLAEPYVKRDTLFTDDFVEVRPVYAIRV